MIIVVVINLTYTLSWVQLAIKKYWERKNINIPAF